MGIAIYECQVTVSVKMFSTKVFLRESVFIEINGRNIIMLEVKDSNTLYIKKVSSLSFCLNFHNILHLFYQNCGKNSMC